MKACLKLAAKDLQLLVRIEEAALNTYVKAVVDGKIKNVHSPLGCCVCRTCGYVGPYQSMRLPGIRQMQGGHVVGGRSYAVVLLERNVYPQCSLCNLHKPGHGCGEPKKFEQFVREVYGNSVFEGLIARKNGKRGYEVEKPTTEELLNIRAGFRARIRIAKQRLEKSCN